MQIAEQQSLADRLRLESENSQLDLYVRALLSEAAEKIGRSSAQSRQNLVSAAEFEALFGGKFGQLLRPEGRAWN